MTLLFKTRAAAMEYREEKYGYIRRRADLRREPFGWQMPSIVKVAVLEIKPDAQRVRKNRGK